jgi:hypothetical protein
VSARIAAFVAALAAQSAPTPSAEPAVALELAPTVLGLATLDADGDGRQELLVARESGLEIVELAAATGSAPQLRARLDRGESRTFAWCVATSRQKDAVWLVRDDGLVQRWEPAAADAAPVEVVRATGSTLPTGVFSLQFARDLDGDGRIDLALPEPGGLRLWFTAREGEPKRGPLVRHRIEADLDLPRPDDTSPDVGATLSVPAFDVSDQNGDGHPDLAFASRDRRQYFWTDANGALPESPTFDVDLGELREKLKTGEAGLIDPTNLFKVLQGLVTADVRDLDHDGRADLLLRQGPKVSVFGGTSAGIDRSKATQVLKTSGNLIAAFSADDDGDGKLDLCMLQAADVSVGEVLLWVVIGGKLELDLFTYLQEEKLRFARSPSRRRRLKIDVPAILGLADEIEKSATFTRLAEELARLPVAVDLDGDGTRDDVAVLEKDGVVHLYEGGAPPELTNRDGAVWRTVMERFDRQVKGEDDAVITIPLLDVVDWVPMPGSRLRAAIAGRAAARTLGTPDPATAPPAEGGEATATRRLLVVVDLDGDRRDDLLLVDPGDGSSTMRLERFVTR